MHTKVPQIYQTMWHYVEDRNLQVGMFEHWHIDIRAALIPPLHMF